MTTPVILVSAGRQNNYTPRREVQTITAGCDIDYLAAVQRSGSVPLMLPFLASSEGIAAALSVADGLLLSGGGDILSLTYGEEPHVTSKLQDPTRDAMELEATRLALEMGMPVLGICRGLQLLNVACKGTLIQDIPAQVPGAVKHYADGLDVVLLHTMDIESDSLLAKVMETTTMAVNSWHHQAVKAVGNGLRISARARDGVVEAIEAVDGRPLLALQCHPEECAATYPQFQRVFDWLATEARSYQSRKRR